MALSVNGLTGRSVVVTGANGQLGQAIAMRLQRSGALVFATDVHDVAAPNFQPGRYFRMDVTSEKSIQRVADILGSRLDVLVNNAGIGLFTPFEQRTAKEIRAVLDVNVLGPILCSKIFSEGMRVRRQGTIINIASVYGMVPPDKRIYGSSGRNSSEVYGASKAAVIQLTRYLASYLGEYGIRVNSVSPGGVANDQHPHFVERYVDKTPLGRMAEPEDVAAMVAFLCGDECPYLTGQNIAVEGGFTLNY